VGFFVLSKTITMPVFDSQTLVLQMTQQLEQMINTTRTEFLPLSQQQLNWKYDVKKWSVAECLAHLLLANAPYIAQLERSLAHAKSGAQPASFQSGFFGEYFTNLMLPKPDGEVKIKMQTAAWFNPSTQSQVSASVVSDFIAQLEALLRITKQAGKLNWKKHRIKTVLGILLQFRYVDAIRFVIAHSQRHIVQAQRVMKREHFAQY
jgi:hypothetical protein